MNTRRIPAVLTAAATCALLGACGTSNSQQTGTGLAAEAAPVVDKAKWPKPTPERGLAKGMELPLERYMQSYADTVALGDGMRRLQEKCMADYGLTVKLPVDGANPPPSDNDANMERRYGLTIREDAAAYGYGLPGEADGPVKQTMPDLTEVEVEVLTGHKKAAEPEPGTPPLPAEPARAEHNGKALHKGGCTGWAKQQVGQPDDEELLLVTELNGRSFSESMQAADVQEATAAWAKCMADKGHTDLKDPFAAADSIQHVEGAPTEVETKLATDEVDCKESTNLVQVWFDRETTIQKQMIADNQARLDAVRAANTKAVTAAGAVT